MFKFVQDYFNKQKGIKLYRQSIIDGISDNVIDDKEQKELDMICKDYQLQERDLIAAKKEGFTSMFNKMISNHKITEEDRKHINEFLNNFHLSQEQADFNQEAFNKYYSLTRIEEGKFPEVTNDPVHIMYQSEEKLCWACDAKLMKYKNVTTRVSYSGPRTSIRIMRGLSYRAGYYNVARQTQEFLVKEDAGVFWMTNKRIGFKGFRKSFDFPYTKLLSFELSNNGLTIAKEGRESYFLIQLDDYDVPCSIASHILNNEHLQ